jgi:serine/threonine protein kinase
MGGCCGTADSKEVLPPIPKKKLEEYEQGRIIGEGSFCRVSEVKEKATDILYAEKCVKKRKDPTDDAIKMEVHCLWRLQFAPFIVRLVAMFEDDKQWIGILEHCSQGELWKHIDHSGCLDKTLSRWYIGQIALGLSEVHSAGIVHRDLKAENVLVDKLGHIRLIDFGTARDWKNPQVPPMRLSEDKESWHRVGTPAFMAPEAINGVANDRLSDIWSLGCTSYQILLGAPPFLASATFFTWKKARDANFHFPSVGMPIEAQAFIRDLCKVSPTQRLGSSHPGALIEGLKSHKFFAGFEWGQLADKSVHAPKISPAMTLLRIVCKAYMKEVLFDEKVSEDSSEVTSMKECMDEVKKVKGKDGLILRTLAESILDPWDGGDIREAMESCCEEPELSADIKVELKKFIEEAARRKRDISGEPVPSNHISDTE